MAYVNLKLAAAGLSMAKMGNKEENFMRLVEPILKSYRKHRSLHVHAAHATQDKHSDRCRRQDRACYFYELYKWHHTY